MKQVISVILSTNIRIKSVPFETERFITKLDDKPF